MRLIKRKYIFLGVLVLTILIAMVVRLAPYQVSNHRSYCNFTDSVKEPASPGPLRPNVNLSTPVSIISGAEFELNHVCFLDDTKKVPLEVAYPKPVFHPSNSLAYKPPNKTDLREEEFTIVMLTYKRRGEMLSNLKNLVSLPFLNKIILIWNDMEPPGGNFTWPRLDVPLQVVYMRKNSLNNRFRSFSLVATEAVLSLDNDVYISHEDVLFAFSVWKQHRDQIVGFAGRGVIWNTTTTLWEYDTSLCSVSLVLTSYAFLHRKYLSIYTQQMSKIILDRIDNKTNCEDIAMNFLVSHISQKAPIKVTPKNDWKCPKCADDDGLWRDPTHFEERNECVNFFVQIFGYIPLFKSDYRADDLFQNNTKCIARSS